MAPAIYRPNDIDIIDIRQEELELSLGKEIVRGLNPQDGRPRSLPTILLYDTEGLKLFEQITYLEDYYLTNAEIEVLLTHARSIVERIPDNAQLIELGSGCVILETYGLDARRVDTPACSGSNKTLGIFARSRYC